MIYRGYWGNPDFDDIYCGFTRFENKNQRDCDAGAWRDTIHHNERLFICFG